MRRNILRVIVRELYGGVLTMANHPTYLKTLHDVKSERLGISNSLVLIVEEEDEWNQKIN